MKVFGKQWEVKEPLRRGLSKVRLLDGARRLRSAVASISLPVRYYIAARWCALSGIAGGLAVPPPRLTWLVAGHHDVVKSLRNGILTSQSIRHALFRNGLHIEDFPEILDFGCGSGRVLRNWQSLKSTKVCGTDYNVELISWCEANLPFAHFEKNGLYPPSCWPDEKFAFIYACSVFTHLEEPLQHSWMFELRRVLKPGGYLLITTHGEFWLKVLSTGEKARFHDGRLIIQKGGESGSNDCCVFHPVDYVKGRLAKGFVVVDYIPEGAVGTGMQDLYLLKKE
jgi:SAM-dependent methyltransferase